MAGGPSGTAEGISNASLAWAIIMSAFAVMIQGPSALIAMSDWLHTFGDYDPTLNLGVDGYYLKVPNKSLVVSILSAGTFFGALLAYPMGDMVGRKRGIVCACVVFALGVGLQLDTNWTTFVVGRVIAGLGVGLVSCLVPMYQSECSPKNIRGLIVGLYQLAITIGALLAAIILNATKDRLSHAAWRIPIAVQFAWAFVLGGGMLLLPESPRYLLHKNRVKDACAALGRLSNHPADSPEVDAECAEIILALKEERAIGSGSYVDCFKNTQLKNGLRTWTGILLQGWQQLTGINFIFYYGTTFFASAGITNPFIITVICDLVNSTLPSIRLSLTVTHYLLNLACMTIVGVQLIDRVGRRRLLLIGAAGMMICEYIVAIVGVTAGQIAADGAVNLAAQRVLIAFVCFYISFFATSWGPVAWVITGEIFPLNIRAKGMSLAVASNWLWNFSIGYATPYLVDTSTKGQPNGVATAALHVNVFFIWGSTCLGCLIFTYFFIPETKGLSLEQIDLLYKESSIRGSEKYRREMIMADISHARHEKLEATSSHGDSSEV
ncbi:monosaccharide importer [Mycena maculata]|uniref:Monosaccharide importer n=1 Tax=Mycena maculata TaxID=230809 RepID=A0AAD7NBS2_9AGAR|nr:monosaccharide importer [Mycena maculata]